MEATYQEVLDRKCKWQKRNVKKEEQGEFRNDMEVEKLEVAETEGVVEIIVKIREKRWRIVRLFIMGIWRKN